MITFTHGMLTIPLWFALVYLGAYLWSLVCWYRAFAWNREILNTMEEQMALVEHMLTQIEQARR